MPDLLRVIETGAGPPLVLVHGAMDRAGGLARVARHLRDHRVLRYDRRGYSASRALGPGDLSEHVADLLGVIEAHTSASDRPAVVGHSYGGLVALGAAHLRPDLVLAVGAYEPPTPWHPEWPGGIETWPGDPEAAADLVIERAVGAERWARAPAALRAVRRSEGVALLAEMRSLVGAGSGLAPEALGAITVPAEIAIGGQSPEWVAPGAADLAERLGAAEPIVLEGLAHRAPVTDAATLARWCRSVALGGSGASASVGVGER